MSPLAPFPPCSYHPEVQNIRAYRVAEPRSSLYLALGRAVARNRSVRGYSEAQLAARAGMRDIDMAVLEQGELPLPLATLERLAGALGLRASELLREAELTMD